MGFARIAGVAVLSGVLMALAFPKYGWSALAPLGACGLFWMWSRLSWKRAFAAGYFAGMVFFSITFAWIGHTVDSFLGNFAFIIAIGPGILEGFWFGVAGLLASLAYRRLHPAIAPAAAACAFVLADWARSVGVMGAPFSQLGYTQVEGWLAPLAAFGGAYAVTFAIVLMGAYLAPLFAGLTRARLAQFACAWIGVAVVAALCWAAWPARHIAAPTVRVAAIQANIPQAIKWSKAAQDRAIADYTRMTLQAARAHPQLIVWPESVIPVNLNAQPALIAQFYGLAHQAGATLVVGTNDVFPTGVPAVLRPYDDLYVFTPGKGFGIYHKRQLVPFAEHLPYEWLHNLPFANLVSDYATGTDPTVFRGGPLAFAPLICWESAFSDLAHDQLHRGAQLLVVATDDAWFGTTSGPYQHTQIAQMRAIEAGTWVVRAAATGISAIIAPDGTFHARSGLDVPAIVIGAVGPPTGSVFAKIGPTPIVFAIGAFYVIALALALRRSA